MVSTVGRLLRRVGGHHSACTKGAHLSSFTYTQAHSVAYQTGASAHTCTTNPLTLGGSGGWNVGEASLGVSESLCSLLTKSEDLASASLVSLTLPEVFIFF